ncbi:hypothetical protein HZ326_30445 [Fusarium oxysporum f. sp. albedinis]|nr:hypothetical protein HZ326_30445 [Fusarium oxysporum f. sp. albedinis]
MLLLVSYTNGIMDCFLDAGCGVISEKQGWQPLPLAVHCYCHFSWTTLSNNRTRLRQFVPLHTSVPFCITLMAAFGARSVHRRTLNSRPLCHSRLL